MSFAFSSLCNVSVIFALQVSAEGIPVGLVEECVDQRVHTRGDITHPHKHIHEVLKMLTVVLADSDHHIGDEERTPHHQKEEKHNAQNFTGPLLISNSFHHSSSNLSFTTNLMLFKQKCGHQGGGAVFKHTSVTCLSGGTFGVPLGLLRKGTALLLENTEGEVVADHHDDQRNEEGNERTDENKQRLIQNTSAVHKHLLLILEAHHRNGK